MSDLTKYYDKAFISDLVDYFIFTAYTLKCDLEPARRTGLENQVRNIQTRLATKLEILDKLDEPKNDPQTC